MAELTSKERLQPSLLDRLIDNAPDKLQESREQRVLSLRQLRHGVLRDMIWLLNTANLASTENLDNYPEVARSVVNYGAPHLTGHSISGLDISTIERKIRQTLLDFEPRILRHSLKIRVLATDDQMNLSALSFTIEGQLWAQPLPLHLLIRTDIDTDTGEITVKDLGG